MAMLAKIDAAPAEARTLDIYLAAITYKPVLEDSEHTDAAAPRIAFVLT